MKIVALIPARGGSKGIPNKNRLNIAGKPLIAWSIEHALSSTAVDQVIVSTDCDLIASLSKNLGASVPFLRPSNLAEDTSTTESVMLHCVDFLYSQQNYPDYLILLQPTSPIRSQGQIDGAINFLFENNYDSILSVSATHRFFWKNQQNPVASYPIESRPRRQDLILAEQNYIETGSVYIVNVKKFIEAKNRLFGNIGLYLTPEEESFEIDSWYDFLVCESILNYKKNG